MNTSFSLIPSIRQPAHSRFMKLWGFIRLIYLNLEKTHRMMLIYNVPYDTTASRMANDIQIVNKNNATR
ncbi:hypothetical protein BJ165DRAFT_1477230 [Panaeolus papilionaceus]|nr:hypothetical protein BJ165DRAFT_1477230 [Panaeolus papilionaceus]